MTNSRIVSGTLWLTAAKLSTTMIGFVSTIILARLLTPDDYGLVALATATLAIVNAFTELPVAVALIQVRRPTRKDYNSAFTVNFGRGLLISAALAAAAPAIAALDQDDRLIPVFLALAVVPAVNGAYNPYFVTFEKDLRFSKNFAVELSAKLTAVLISIVIAVITRSYWALISSLVTASVIGVVMSYVLAPYRPGFSLASLRALWSFSSWLTLVSIVNTLNQRLDSYVVASFLGKSTLGQFTVGSDVANIVHAPASPIMRALYSRFCQLGSSLDAARDTYRRSQQLIIAALLPAGFGLGLIADPLVRAALGEQWRDAAIVIQIISPMIAIELLAGASYPLAMAMGRTRALFWRDLAVFLFRLPLMIGGAYYYGLAGLVMSRGIASVFGLLLNLRLVNNLIEISVVDQIKGAWRSGISTALMSCAVLALLPLTDGRSGVQLYVGLGVTIAVGAFVYIAAHFALWFGAGRPEAIETQVVGVIAKLTGHAGPPAERGQAEKDLLTYT